MWPALHVSRVWQIEFINEAFFHLIGPKFSLHFIHSFFSFVFVGFSIEHRCRKWTGSPWASLLHPCHLPPRMERRPRPHWSSAKQRSPPSRRSAPKWRLLAWRWERLQATSQLADVRVFDGHGHTEWRHKVPARSWRNGEVLPQVLPRTGNYLLSFFLPKQFSLYYSFPVLRKSWRSHSAVAIIVLAVRGVSSHQPSKVCFANISRHLKLTAFIFLFLRSVTK